jgi:hypothetical protein
MLTQSNFCLAEVEQMWSCHLGRTALNVPELRPTAWSSPAQSLFPQVSALPGPNWQI